MSKSFLIDVRSPAEFATGALDGAINIEYTAIAELSGDARVGRGDAIALYCRSGRRSAIALDTLKELGYRRVRDLGTLEEADETLRVERQQKEQEEQRGKTGKSVEEGERKGEQGAAADRKTLESSTKMLLDGLRALE
ncbi:Rhodanese-like domain-containing protein [Phyllosticta capitalensis]|uniref:Rhodanese-like domain-containing protein n=1 Tax=Phyllosticta capitalensis TaxID=121624 RepID=A0ABR1YUE3_9PEZI